MNKNKNDDFRPSLTLQDIVNDLVAREEKGVREYGANVDRRDLNFRAWLRHLYEELLDGAMYARRALNEHDGRGYEAHYFDYLYYGPALDRVYMFAIPIEEYANFFNYIKNGEGEDEILSKYGKYRLYPRQQIYLYDEAFITATSSDYKFPSNVFRDWDHPTVQKFNYRTIDGYNGEVNYWRIKPHAIEDGWSISYDEDRTQWLSVGYADTEWAEKIYHKSLEVRPGFKE